MPNAFGFCTRFSKPSRERRYSSVSTRRRRPTLARANADCSPIAVADPSEGARAPRDAVASRSGETLLRFSPRRSRSSSSPRRSRPPLRRVASRAPRLGSSAAMTSGASARHRADGARACQDMVDLRLRIARGIARQRAEALRARRSSAGSPPRRARRRRRRKARAATPRRPTSRPRARSSACARPRSRSPRSSRGGGRRCSTSRRSTRPRRRGRARPPSRRGATPCARRTSSAGARTNTSP